jgi:hypothetical protein
VWSRIIGHFKQKKVYMYMYHIPNGFRDRAISLYSSKIVYKKEILRTQVKDKVTLRLTVSRSVGLGVEPHLGLMTSYLLLFDSYGLVFVGRPLWRQDRSVFCIYCWPLAAQSLSVPSSLGLAIIFYCLRFENSLFVASYDSQGHGGGIRPRLHTAIVI